LFFSQRGADLAYDKDANIYEGTPTPEPSPEATPADNSDNNGDIPDAVKISLVTNKGKIELELYPAVAPKTVANFMLLAGQGFYDGIKFHRVIPEFMIQGGDPNSLDADPANDGRGGPGYKFEDEINPTSLGLSELQIAQLEARGYEYNYELKSLPVTTGSIAMANAGPNTNGSQFFIVTIQDQPHLNGLHTVFGKVTAGMDIVKSIKQNDFIKSIELPEQE